MPRPSLSASQNASASGPASASLFGAMVLCLLGGAWWFGVVHWTATRTFFWKERGVSRPVTPDTHPILFWGWVVVSCVGASLILGRGVIEFHRWWRGRRPPGKQE